MPMRNGKYYETMPVIIHHKQWKGEGFYARSNGLSNEWQYLGKDSDEVTDILFNRYTVDGYALDIAHTLLKAQELEYIDDILKADGVKALDGILKHNTMDEVIKDFAKYTIEGIDQFETTLDDSEGYIILGYWRDRFTHAECEHFENWSYMKVHKCEGVGTDTLRLEALCHCNDCGRDFQATIEYDITTPPRVEM